MDHKSIRDNLIQPLKDYGAQVKLYGHFNIPQVIHNARSGENVELFKNKGVQLLPFDHVMLAPQKDEETAELLEKFKQHNLQSNDTTVNTHRNLLNQYRSLQAVMQIIQSIDGNQVDAVLFARPDLEYLNPLISADVLPKVLDGNFDLLTPTWHRWGGLNDRVCLCNLHAAKIYANRISIIDEVISRKMPMNAESILLHAVRKNFLKNGDLSIQAVRVRASGYTVDEGFNIDYLTQLKFFNRRVISKIRRIRGQ